jgi:hypothetical protein
LSRHSLQCYGRTASNFDILRALEADYQFDALAHVRPDMRPKGWLISVKAPEAVWLYATVADTLEHAELLVGNHCAVSNEKVRFERVLTDGEIERLDLKPSKVTRYA